MLFCTLHFTDRAAARTTVTTVALARSTPEQSIRLLAEVRSLGTTTLVAPVTGEVVGPFLTTGSVAAGSVVARNEPADLTSSIASARAQLALTQTQYNRAKTLVVRGVTAQATLDQARQALASARGALLALQVKARQQVIKAPFAGMLHYVVAPGAVVYKGDPIAKLSGRAVPWISALAPPSTASRLSVGQKARFSSSSSSGEGAIVAIGTDARRDGMVQIRVAPSRGNHLLPGQWIWVDFKEPAAPAFNAPARALVMRGADTLVYVVRHDTARAVPVRVIAERGGRAWFSGKLTVGERIALSGNTRLADGAAVAELR